MTGRPGCRGLDASPNGGEASGELGSRPNPVANETMEGLNVLTYAEAATDFWSPCCGGHGVYADFACDDENETLIGFRCTECGEGYPADYKFDED